MRKNFRADAENVCPTLVCVIKFTVSSDIFPLSSRLSLAPCLIRLDFRLFHSIFVELLHYAGDIR